MLLRMNDRSVDLTRYEYIGLSAGVVDDVAPPAHHLCRRDRDTALLVDLRSEQPPCGRGGDAA